MKLRTNTCKNCKKPCPALSQITFEIYTWHAAANETCHKQTWPVVFSLPGHAQIDSTDSTDQHFVTHLAVHLDPLPRSPDPGRSHVYLFANLLLSTSTAHCVQSSCIHMHTYPNKHAWNKFTLQEKLAENPLFQI